MPTAIAGFSLAALGGGIAAAEPTLNAGYPSRLRAQWSRRDARITETPPGPIVITSITTQDDADAFREITEEWVTQHFNLEDAERAFLADPVGRIVERGGDVLIARDPDSGAALGCVALIAYPGGVVELAKMGVRPAARGIGTGRQLLTAAIRRARDLGGARLFLGTSSKLASALYLYEQAGFVRTERSQLPVATDYYPRADVLMELM